MRTLLKCAIVALVLLAASPVMAQDFDKGLAAAKRGDYATALRERKPLAKLGDTRAQHNLGLMYRKGDGVPKDDAQAMKWYRKAAEQGHTRAQFDLGLGVYGFESTNGTS